jgi:hypothetical protein
MLTDTKKAYLYILAKRQTEERIKVNWKRELYECGFDTEWVEYAFATLGCTKEAFNKICAEWDLYLANIHSKENCDIWNTRVKAKELWVNSTRERMKDFWWDVVIEESTQKPEQSTTENKPRGRGKARNFSEIMNNDPNGERLKKLHKCIVGNKGKEVAEIIRAAMKIGWIKKPTFTEVEKEFGNIGHKSGYNRYMVERGLEDEIENAICRLDEH